MNNKINNIHKIAYCNFGHKRTMKIKLFFQSTLGGGGGEKVNQHLLKFYVISWKQCQVDMDYVVFRILVYPILDYKLTYSIQ